MNVSVKSSVDVIPIAVLTEIKLHCCCLSLLPIILMS